MTFATCPTWAQPGEKLVEEQELSHLQQQQQQQQQHHYQLQQQQRQNERIPSSTGEQQSLPSDMAVSVPDDDFTKFLHLGDIGLSFPLNNDDTEHLPIARLTDNADAHAGIQEELRDLEMEMCNAGTDVYMQQNFLAPGQQSALFDNSYQHHQQKPMPELFTSQPLTSAPQQFAFEKQQEEQQLEEQRLRMQYSSITGQRYSRPNGIPPTPTSLKMQPLCHNYTPQTDIGSTPSAASTYYINADDAQFTPLVSPAVTPGDGNLDFATKYALPGTCFSPLSSPALDAQLNRRSYSQHGHTTDSSAATSPLGLDMDDVTYVTRPETEVSRKIRKRTSTPRSVGTVASGKASPNIRPQRRRGTVKPISSSKETKEPQDGGQSSRTRVHYPTGTLIASSRDNSDGDSNSPDLLNENPMAPPPKPSSINNSPSITAHRWQNAISRLETGGQSPATPASLMHLSSEEKESITKRAKLIPKTTLPEVQVMEDLTLPDAATPSASNTAIASTGSVVKPITPSITAEKSGALLRSVPNHSTSNAIAQAKVSPQSPATDGPWKTGDPATKSSRNLKKRDNGGSKVVSPALRPKISPNIKPLLPEGANLSENVHTLLLASKSNYQNILDGTGIPGVHYPEALSKNLNSKRTSHKIAEQGRRNRINTALQEMQSLLPTPPSSHPSSESVSALEPTKNATKSYNEDDAHAAIYSGTDHEKRKLPSDTNVDTGRSQQQQQHERQSTESSSPIASVINSTSNPPAPVPSSSSSTTTSLQQNSKAATIENAIEYIKLLKREARERDILLEKRGSKLQELQAQLDKAEQKGKNVLQRTEEDDEMMEMSDDRVVMTDRARDGASVETSSSNASSDDDLVATL